MSIRNILRKAAELVVELPPEEQKTDIDSLLSDPPVVPTRKSVAELIKEAPGPSLEEIKMPDTPPPVPKVESEAPSSPLSPSGEVDYSAIYSKAGLGPAPFSAEQAWDVIHSLPESLPLEVKRSTVQATLQAMGKAMGVNTQGVVTDAGRKMAALAAYEDLLSHQAGAYEGSLRAKIADLESQIAAHQAEIEKTQQLLKRAVDQCKTESDRLDDVLEFFTLDQAPSRNS